MMENLKRKVTEHAPFIVDVIEDTVDFGISFEKALPAASFFCYRDEAGNTYTMKLELTILHKLGK